MKTIEWYQMPLFLVGGGLSCILYLDKYNIKHLLQIPRDIININKIRNNILDYAMALFLRNLKERKWKCQWLSHVQLLGIPWILCDPMDYSPPVSSVHGILQVRMLEWVAIPFSSGSSWSRDQTWIFHIVGKFFTV